MSVAMAEPTIGMRRARERSAPWSELSLLVAARAVNTANRAVSGARETVARARTNHVAPVIVIVIGVAVVAAAGGLIAFLTAWCVTQGYAGFGAVLNITTIDNGTQYSVSFQCVPWPWDA
jgi:hypothetical protein